MILGSKVILFPLKGIFLWATLPKVPRYGMMADNSSLSWNHAPSYSAWNCAYQLESSFSVSLHPSLDVCVESQLKRYSTSHSVSWSWVARSSRSSILLDFPFLLVVMLDGVLKARRRDKDEDQINTLMKCTLDREYYTSLRFPFVLPYPWISGRESCLVGVSCHIPSSGLL